MRHLGLRSRPHPTALVRWLVALASLTLPSSPAAAQYAIAWWTVDGGGTTAATGGAYALAGTVGQPDAGGPSVAGTYTVHSGFWGLVANGGGGPQADLTINKTDNLGTAVPGLPITYTILVTNPGPDPAVGANVTDALPGALLSASWTCTPSDGATCTAGPVNGSIADSVSLPVGGAVSYTLTATVSAAAIGTLANTASVTVPAGVSDPNPANNSATDSNSLTPLVDRRITQIDSADPIGPYGNVTWTLNVTNLGPSDGTGLTLVDTLPSQVTFVASIPGAPTCVPLGSSVSCNLGALAALGSTSVQVTASANPGIIGLLTNVATVGGAEPDPQSTNNSATELTRVLFVKGDLNLDLGTDLLFRLNTTAQNDVWMMNGTTRAGAPITIAPALPSLDWQIAGVDDFNADRRNDLLVWNAVTGAAEFWLLNGTARTGAAVSLAGALPPPWKPSSTGDFNADTRPDIVYRNTSTQKIEIWTMNGTTHAGTIMPSPDQAQAFNWEIVGSQDWNGDQNTDFLWYNATSGKIVLWFMDANAVRLTGQFTNPANAGNNNWNVLAMGDYGVGPAGLSDTKDIVWRNSTSGKVVVWHMDLAGNRTAGVFTTPDAPSPNPTDWTIAGPR